MIKLAPEGSLEEHTPRLVRSLHGSKPGSKNPEIICTVEWRRDDEKGFVPRASSVSYADLRR
jgi:hypothetical protein